MQGVSEQQVTVLTAGGIGHSGAGKVTRSNGPPQQQQSQNQLIGEDDDVKTLEYEPDDHSDGDEHHDLLYHDQLDHNQLSNPNQSSFAPYSDDTDARAPVSHQKSDPLEGDHTMVWLIICFLGIMASFVCYGLLLEYTTSGGRQLHELSFLFVTSGLYTLTAAAGRYVRDETPTTIPPARFAVLGLTSMGSTFCSVRSLRCVCVPLLFYFCY
jgi:hypothetical protein